jgi:Flp pilus assembly CpaF family ATPase
MIVVGEVRGAEAFELTRAANAGCGMACTIHANSASDALNALVNAALMAGENVPEPVVRKVFAASIDLVVHLGRGVDASGRRIVRETMEIRAMVPALHDDFSTEALFVREHLGAPLDWTGALPPTDLAERIEGVLPAGTSLAQLLHEGAVAW